MSSKADYLKKYLEPEKNKKKKKKVKSKGNLTVRDNDVGWDEMQVQDEDEGPTIAAVIDDRPEELKKKQDGWKAFGNDKSPVRKKKRRSKSPIRRRKSPDSELIRKRADSSDNSPVRHRTRHDSEDNSPKRVNSSKRNERKRADSSDESPVRTTRKRADSSDESPVRTNRKRADSSDNSPPRRARKRADSSDESPVRVKNGSPDQSPPRNRRKRADSSDESPPRRRRNDSDESPQRNPLGDDQDDDRPAAMADGGRAGINTKSDFRTAKRDKFANSNMSKIIEDAKNQETVYRERGTGKKRNFEKEHEESEEVRKKKEEELKNYKVWNKGKIQLEEKEENIASYFKETKKPLARYKDDEDYNQLKKSEMHLDDPMYAYVMKHKRVETKKKRAKSSKPVYTGGVPNTNRFNIPPGYRWDGVDRGTGYESRYFEYLQKVKQNNFDAWRANTDDF